MTSPDGDDPADRRPADGTPDDSDPVRLSPPVDPWLTEAPTSVLGDAGSAPDQLPPTDQLPPPGQLPPTEQLPPTAHAAPAGQTPPADTARFGSAAAFDGPPSGWADPSPQRRRGRRAARWVVAVLAVGALFIAGMLATDVFGSGGDGRGTGPSTAASPAAVPVVATTTPAARKTTSAPASEAGGQPSATVSDQPGSSGSAAAPGAGGPVVVYEVTASGSRNVGSVSYTDQDGDIIRRNGIRLPWRTTFTVGGQRKPLVLIAQRNGGGDAGPVTCTITLDGKVLSSTTADGRYAAPECSG
ncbi:MmpS family transport accessory protein [Actinoplanes nipponensis]|uniref:MmpS family transport accessory protein n=1 Tax=Actinoplanes nipponensis TaxID=135950 RepID=UPI001940D66B|nr:MmpS family transport accessory protein [Actinoplanes nipponensis]